MQGFHTSPSSGDCEVAADGHSHPLWVHTSLLRWQRPFKQQGHQLAPEPSSSTRECGWKHGEIGGSDGLWRGSDRRLPLVGGRHRVMSRPGRQNFLRKEKQAAKLVTCNRLPLVGHAQYGEADQKTGCPGAEPG